jgi:hypothetical protein
MEHRWEGWPGAWCLDCGIEDPNEVCLADGLDPYSEEGCPHDPKHVCNPCTEPGSQRHDPYARALKDKERHEKG